MGLKELLELLVLPYRRVSRAYLLLLRSEQIDSGPDQLFWRKKMTVSDSDGADIKRWPPREGCLGA